MKNLFLQKEIARVGQPREIRISGRVTHVIGLLIESAGPKCCVGEICYVYGKKGMPLPCEVVGFKESKVLLMPLGELSQVAPGAEVYPTGEMHRVAVSPQLVGRILDGLGNPIDGRGEVRAEKFYPVMAPPPPPLSRRPIRDPFETQIKAIDAITTLGRGGRIGIFSSPGVGKSTLMGKIAQTGRADVNVIALIGERGREVREFIERELGPDGLSRSVVVVATADQSALLRSKGAVIATAIAEYFRDLGKDVLLMMDSISRYAMALREIGLTIGEPPLTRGYTPSVFAQLPRLVERAGNNQVGSITGIYTILSEEQHTHDPLPEQVRSLLDGHLYLSRALAQAGFFPPIDLLNSLSRVMHQITSPEHQAGAKKLRSLLHVYHEAEELIRLGAYAKGSDARIDEAIGAIDQIHQFLQQEGDEKVPLEKTLSELQKVVTNRKHP